MKPRIALVFGAFLLVIATLTTQVVRLVAEGMSLGEAILWILVVVIGCVVGGLLVTILAGGKHRRLRNVLASRGVQHVHLIYWTQELRHSLESVAVVTEREAKASEYGAVSLDRGGLAFWSIQKAGQANPRRVAQIPWGVVKSAESALLPLSGTEFYGIAIGVRDDHGDTKLPLIVASSRFGALVFRHSAAALEDAIDRRASMTGPA
ncbi:hypothetical protein [Agromyces subbeticus]|uniref:hypothetical protein n=1 Tax=Agromyces subbeticus TaxID=293890 RepID=UPI0012EB8F36|nr:hypothetical protein [Agromyces subbeticus]